MLKYLNKKASLLFSAMVLIIIVAFSFIGSTFAYFHVQKDIAGSFYIGSVSASWFINDTEVSEGNTYNLAGTNGALVRGAEEGTYLTKTDGSAGGVLRLRGDNNSSEQYVRIKPKATVVYNSNEVDVTSYITFKYIVDQFNYTLGSANFWPKASDGWYYYVSLTTNNILSPSGFAIVCNNLVLSGAYPTNYTGLDLTITFEFESIQCANNPVASVWGAEAATILGLSN
ncbi:MAG: hypothetical protein IJX26_03825 [Clostridia bacterium]|nr:hypothetical protein [Clostridia bacterium]